MTVLKLKGHLALIDNTGQRALMTTQIRLRDLLKVYKINQNINRDINYTRIPKLTKYIDGFDVPPGVFFPAMVCAYSGDPLKNYNSETSELEVSSGSHLVVIDGQHRIKSLETYINNPKNDNGKKEEVLNSDFTLQLYFGLSEEDMKSLFADINSNSVKVSMSLITSYDSREILNVLTKELYEVSNYLQMIGVEFKKSRITRPKDKDFTTSARLKKFISIILFGKQNLSIAEERLLKNNYDRVLSFLDKFFYVFTTSVPKNPGNVLEYVLGHEAVQNAVALIIYQSIYNNNKLELAIDWEERLDFLEAIDWSITADIWQSYLIKARMNTVNEHFSIDVRHEKAIFNVLTKELNELI